MSDPVFVNFESMLTTPPDWPPGVGTKLKSPQNIDPRLLKATHNTLVWKEKSKTGIALVYKLYYRRGWVRWIRQQATQFKVEKEYLCLKHLLNNGIPCSVPIGWSKGISRPHQRYELLVTEAVDQAVAFDQWLKQTSDTEALNSMMSQLGKLVRRMHVTGFFHGALFTRNLLLGSTPDLETPTLYLIDTDMSGIYKRSLVGSKLAQLDLTHLLKDIHKKNAQVSLHHFMLAYGTPSEAVDEELTKLLQAPKRPFHRNYNRALAFFSRLLY